MDEFDWDGLQVIKDPDAKQVEVSFIKNDEGGTTIGSDLPCVRILAPDDYFPYKDNSGHYYIAYLYSPAPVDITGTVTHTTGGTCEANSIVVPTEMDATSTFTIPKGATEVRVDLTLNTVLVDVSQTPDYKAAYTATITSVTNGKACGEPQCIKFNAGTSVIPPEPDPGPEPQPEVEVPPDDDQFPECGGQDCAGLSSSYLSVVDAGNVISFLDVTGNGTLSTAKWPASNDLLYNSHRCADPEGRLSKYYYIGSTSNPNDIPYSNLSSAMETYIGGTFCRPQAKACVYNGLSTFDNLRYQKHLLLGGQTRGFDQLTLVSNKANWTKTNGYIANCSLESVTFHVLLEMPSFPQASSDVVMGIEFRGSLSVWDEPGVSSNGIYTSLFRPSGGISIQFRGDGTMRFLSPTGSDEIGRYTPTPPTSKSVHLVSVTVSGGIRDVYVNYTGVLNSGAMDIDGNIKVESEAKTASAYYSATVGNAAMNGGPTALYSPWDFAGEENFGVKFGYQSGNGINSTLLAISNDATFDALFRRSWTDYASPDYCSRIP